MMKLLSLFIGFLILVGGLLWGYVQHQRPVWEQEIKALATQAQTMPLDSASWETLAQQAHEKLPGFYPFSVITDTLQEGAILWQESEKRPDLTINTEKNIIPKSTIEAWHAYLDNLQSRLQKISRRIHTLPQALIPENYQDTLARHQEKLQQVIAISRDIDTLQKALDEAFEKQSSIMVLLQNQHEPRSTGGFSGSVVLLDFTEEGLAWRFSDIYALDRLIAEEAQEASPDFFHDLSKTISLRDANFWPDFPTSAQRYQALLSQSDLPSPETIIALNLNIIRDLLKITGPIDLDPWHMKVDEHNFDLVLQFLVESKIAGRFSTKAPVDYFAQALVKKIQPLPDPQVLLPLIKDWTQRKDLMIYSQEPAIQKIVSKFEAHGRLDPQTQSDDFLHFDFVSIGANKSEKFVWTKLEHDSSMDPDGLIRNTLKIKRTHALQDGQLESVLDISSLPPNIQNLWQGDLPWKLGAGQNRTILRLWVPPEAQLLSQSTISGPIKTSQDAKMPDFQIWEVPLFISPGESIETQIRYTTRTKQGHHTWRPYFFQLLGTPGRDKKTTFLKSFSTDHPARINYLENQGGTWQELLNTDYRVEVRY